MRWLKACSLFLWYGLALFLALLWVGEWERNGIPGAQGWTSWVQSLVGLLILLGAFVLLHLAARDLAAILAPADRAGAPSEAAAHEECEVFPSRSTLLVGGWLLAFSIVDLAALVCAFTPPSWVTRALLPDSAPLTDLIRPLLPTSEINRNQLQDLLVTMFAAGIGSAITAILGYLEHACIRRDFRRSYVPWYFARPLMGMLLGVIFYFVLKGGLLAVLPAETGNGTTASAASSNLNQFSLAALGTLVGLFSKNALEKLRELFNNVFATQRDFEDELRRRLPADTWKEIEQYFTTQGKDGDANGGDGAGGEGEPPPPPAAPQKPPTDES